jgi:hypothetical protein
MCRLFERRDYVADFIARRIVANDNFNVFVGLGQGAEQCLVKKPRVVGRNDDADEGE